MPRDPFRGLIARPLEAFAASREWFERQLLENEVGLHPASELALGLSTLKTFREKVLVDDAFTFASTDAAYDYTSVVYGIDFLTKAIHWGWQSGLRLDNEHWRALAKHDPVLTRPANSSKPRNLTWETVIASLAASFATDVRFEEPDVTCTYGGKRYAIAAKVAYSPGNVPDLVASGFKQTLGHGDAALVFLDVVGLYPQVHTLLWSRFRNFDDNDEAVSVMTAAVNRWCDNWDLRPLSRRLAAGAPKPAGVAFFVPMLLHLAGAPRPFWYTHLPIAWTVDGPDFEFARAFLGACNVVGDFAPGVDMATVLAAI